MRLVHGVAVSSEKEPSRADLLLSVTLDGLAAKPTNRHDATTATTATRKT